MVGVCETEEEEEEKEEDGPNIGGRDYWPENSGGTRGGRLEAARFGDSNSLRLARESF